MAPTPRLVAALDQGTTSTRCILFNARGDIVSVAQRVHANHYPQPGWVEHDASEIWRHAQAVIGEALAQQGATARDIAALGITNQRETTLLWNRHTGEPVHRALVWQDTRVEALATAYARDGGADRFRALTGLPLASYFSGLKLQWLLDQVPGARAAAAAGDLLFGTMDSWLVWNLTGGAAGGLHVTDVTNASRTQLMSLATLDWDASLLEAFRIPRTVLPMIVSSSAQIGFCTLDSISGVPIAGILGDQQAALVGQTCFAAGEAKNTYGTGCFLLMNTGQEIVPSRAGLVTTVAYRFGDAPASYALEGSIAITGALVQWLRDSLQIIQSSGRDRGAGARGGGQRRRLLRAGLLRPLRAALECRRARGDVGPYPLCHSRAYRPRRARGPPPSRCARCWNPCSAMPACRCRNCGWMAAWWRTGC